MEWSFSFNDLRILEIYWVEHPIFLILQSKVEALRLWDVAGI